MENHLWRTKGIKIVGCSSYRSAATGLAPTHQAHRRRVQLAMRNQQLKMHSDTWVPMTAAVSHQAYPFCAGGAPSSAGRRSSATLPPHLTAPPRADNWHHHKHTHDQTPLIAHLHLPPEQRQQQGEEREAHGVESGLRPARRVAGGRREPT